MSAAVQETEALNAAAPGRVVRLGTRRSDLATTQSTTVADALRARGHEVELVLVTTEGDVNRAPLSRIGGTGVFVSALRDALLAGEIDIAVHSLKDLPVAQPEELVIAAVPEREDPRDALVARDGLTLETLPAGARVGTGSPRREAQLRVARPDIEVVDLRGNVPRRLATVDEGELDAVVLAGAGLRRLGLDGRVTQWLEPQVMVPAPGQGALAVECRSDDERSISMLEPLDHLPTRTATTAERAVLGTLEAGCSAPIGALARHDADRIDLMSFAGPRDGSRALLEGDCARDLPRSTGTPDTSRTDDRVALDTAARALGRTVAEALRAGGADVLPGVGEVPAHPDPTSSKENS
ncbi:hydroxymethylbilane synthase [Kytococcus sedentarius]|uniref:hydroxymethylbilane synthase n=1 Tax=Kytococcus sedentarius TaxID=1276 RepID=UPI0035BC881F